jgi:hypothetical protein
MSRKCRERTTAKSARSRNCRMQQQQAGERDIASHRKVIEGRRFWKQLTVSSDLVLKSVGNVLHNG